VGKLLRKEITKLKQLTLGLGALVEDALRNAVAAFEEGDRELADEVVRADAEINRQEIDVEEEGLKILALHQPVAIDLRLIIAILKMNNDLERIGDLAVNIAERTAFVAGRGRTEAPFDLPRMADAARSMLKKSLDALVNLDAGLAREVCAADDEIDDINRSAYARVNAAIRETPDDAESLGALLSVSHTLERVADHATNIAQDVIYMLEGNIVRHRRDATTDE